MSGLNFFARTVRATEGKAHTVRATEITQTGVPPAGRRTGRLGIFLVRYIRIDQAHLHDLTRGPYDHVYKFSLNLLRLQSPI